ncbi:uncharacterized protein N7500_000801 [Penicillium coprophilum]|uniref:uncharacterized protein n=1 Tax=Penicillium coprophilum TaxID=36646 RepID=UPI00239938FB|nr:uncharacterized protein N7500_000801 [Penicillium coprophilum]KAJ5178102.1 hypothetical protein N7500_000801 [Penicillium coprophilum]
MIPSKRTLEGLEQSKKKRLCRPAPLKLKDPSMPTHLANGDNLSPFLAENGQPSPIPAKLFTNALEINEPSTTPTPLANGDALSPTLFNQSLNISEPSEAAPIQGPSPFSGAGNTQPAEFNPRLSTPNNGASGTANVNWPLPYTRTVGPVNEDGFAVVTQTWYDYSAMNDDSATDSSSGSPRSFRFTPRAFPAPPSPNPRPVLRPVWWSSSQAAPLHHGVPQGLPPVPSPRTWPLQPSHLPLRWPFDDSHEEMRLS